MAQYKIFKNFDEVEPFIDRVAEEADKHRESFGFLPKTAYEENARNGRLWVAVDNNNTYCGHLLRGGRHPVMKVGQLLVHPNHRGKGLAKMLVNEMEEHGNNQHYRSITARVAADLPANKFWQQQRFSVIQQQPGSQQRDRIINIYNKDLNLPGLFDFDDEQSHHDLTLHPAPLLRPDTYALDINVLIDLYRHRKYYEPVKAVLTASLSGNFKICVTAEVEAELRRSGDRFDGRDDPILELAKALPQLPEIPERALNDTRNQLGTILFPERTSAGILRPNDTSARLIHQTVISTADSHIFSSTTQ